MKVLSRLICKLCSKAIDLGNMGKRALTSHAEGKLHKKAANLKKLGIPRMEQFVKVEKRKVRVIMEEQIRGQIRKYLLL